MLSKIKLWYCFKVITGSGKTEVYIELDQSSCWNWKTGFVSLARDFTYASNGKKATDVFWEEVNVYHSKFSIHERTEVWNNVIEKSPKAKIIVGTRSALFLPFQNLGLLIVDEEHELSYKQFDPSLVTMQETVPSYWLEFIKPKFY